MWKYRGKDIKSHEDLHPDCVTIVYELIFLSGKKYIGKTAVRVLRKLKPTKKQLAIRKNYVRKELKNVAFMDYEGSSELIKDEVLISKEIIHQCSSKRTATYLETGCLFEVDAIFNIQYLNKNIGGVYFDNAMDGLIRE